MPIKQFDCNFPCVDNESADSFIQRVFQKFYAKKLPGKSPADFALKVSVGENLGGKF